MSLDLGMAEQTEVYEGNGILLCYKKRRIDGLV